MNERQELLDQANDLSLEFHSNIPTDKLKKMIDNKMNEEVATPQPKVEKAPVNPNLRPRVSRRDRIANAKRKAMKLSVVTITNKDNR